MDLLAMSIAKNLKRFKAYSPVRMLVGLIANQTAQRRYQKALLLNPVTEQIHVGLQEDHILVSNEVVGSPEMQALRINVEELFNHAVSNELVSVVNGRYIRGIHSEAEALYLGESIMPYNALLKLIYRSRLFATLQATHGCEFYCRVATVFKTTARDDIPEGSFRFHRDGHPHFSYKILLYITDVDSLASGPTSYIPGSSKPVIPGFGAYRINRKIDREAYEQHAVMGKSGTFLLFNTNGLHAGGRTFEGERIVATFQLMPMFDPSLDKFCACKSYRFGQLEYDVV